MVENPYPIPRQLRQSGILLGDGGDTYGPFDFEIFDTDDVVVCWRPIGAKRFVEVAGVVVTKVNGNNVLNPLDYFSIKFPSNVPASTRFVVLSSRIAARDAGVMSGTRINPDALEKEFSKIATQQQELRRDLGRALMTDFGAPAMTIDPDVPDGATLMRQGDRLVEGPDVDAVKGDLEAIKDLVKNWASDIISQGSVPIYGTVQGFPALTIPAGLIGVRLNGYSSVGDGGEWPLVYEVANSGPLKAWQRQTNGGSRRWEIAPSIVLNPLMFGASKDISVNSDAGINAAIELAQLRGQRFIDGGGFRYKISSRSAINNKFGIDLLNMALIESVTGGDVQVNTYADRNQRWIGKEYLWGLYNWIKLTSSPVKVFAYGDSTMQAPSGWDLGAGTTPFEAFFQSMWPRLAKQIGLKQPLQVTNRGVGGQAVAGMDFTADLASGMQLMIIKYGINDRTVTGDRDSALRTFADNLFGKLEAVRSAPGGDVTALSIVLVGPSSTYDPATDRDSSWYEGVRGIYEAAARKFRCAYFDTYGYMQDSEWAVGQWLDMAGLHPEGVGSWWIFGHLFNLVFPERELEYWRRNHITNTSGSFDVPLANWNLNTEYFNYGASMKFARTTEGFPATGGLMTMHQADKAGLQMLFPTDNRGVVHFRTYNPASGVASFGQWTGEVKGISLTAPWQEFDAANYGNSYCVRTVDGMVHGRLCIRGGSNLNNGAEIGTLPAGLRPSSIEQFLSFNLAGAIGRIDITPAGKIRVVGGVTSEMLNASFSFRAA